jgi:hypothetical protein
MSSRQEIDQQLIDSIAACAGDPLRFVMFAFPWGEPGELEKHTGPDRWQEEVLAGVRDGLLTLNQAIRIAVSAGNGPGKSTLFVLLMLWALCTFEDTRGVCTANTEVQLRTKTWSEMAKWYRLLICRHHFKLTATAIFSADPEHEKTWRIDAVPWSERNTEAFAGLHNEGKRIVIAFDEASAIPDLIWEVTEGALTDQGTEIIWLVAGNPTRNTGRFRDCFEGLAHRWKTWKVDSRSSRLTNQAQIAQWIADYGEDSDYVRVHVKGEFPRAGSMQFIASDLVDEAMKREPMVTLYDAFVLGIDVARFGDDVSVVYRRKGRDGRTHPPLKFRGLDTMQLAARVAEQYQDFKADAVFVDGGGVGGGVVDRLRQLGVPVFDVQFGAKPDRAQPGVDRTGYANKRAEMWGYMRSWLEGGAIPDDKELRAQLIGLEYSYVMRDGKDVILLEAKADMKRRGLESPDIADALALTFAYPVQPRQNAGRAGRNEPLVQWDYDPFVERAASPSGMQSVWDPYRGRPVQREIVPGDYDPLADKSPR